MPRRPRIEFEGAIYHVSQLGGGRRLVFGDAAAAQAFESCLFEACERSGWRLHAYALLPRGFHLLVETPRGNLVAGMRWLLSTFALRRRRVGREEGPRYLRRYRSVLIEPGGALATAADLVHLSPAEAGLVPAESLPFFRWSSARRRAPGERPAFLECRDWLREAGGWDDSPGGWASYHRHLAVLATDPGEQERRGLRRARRGWAVGSPVWRGVVARRHEAPFGERSGEVRSEWARALDRLLAETGHSREEAAAAPKGAGWKIAIAGRLRRLTTATNAWIAAELSMGTGSSVSVYLTRAPKGASS